MDVVIVVVDGGGPWSDIPSPLAKRKALLSVVVSPSQTGQAGAHKKPCSHHHHHAQCRSPAVLSESAMRVLDRETKRLCFFGLATIKKELVFVSTRKHSIA